MLNKETLVKIAIALLVVAIVWFILKARKKHRKVKIKKHRKVIVTPMPIVEKFDDMDEETEEDVAEEEEGYAPWNADDEDVQEDFDEMSPVEYHSELLE